MGGKKRQRQQTNRQARLAAAAAAKRRATRRRWALAGGSVAAVLAATILVLALTQDDEDEQELTTTPTTAAPAAGSAAGKPCVAPVDPPPPGAPAVPVKVGPPPAQLVSEDLKPGAGATVTPGATITVHYIGVSCSTGKTFDSSYPSGQPVSFPLAEGGVISGWVQGVPGMKVGGQRLLGIPSALAYGGESPPGSGIAPDEALWFVVEVLDAKPA